MRLPIFALGGVGRRIFLLRSAWVLVVAVGCAAVSAQENAACAQRVIIASTGMGAALASGMYLYRLEAGGKVETRKLLLLR